MLGQSGKQLFFFGGATIAFYVLWLVLAGTDIKLCATPGLNDN